jgi:hypothetical protein
MDPFLKENIVSKCGINMSAKIRRTGHHSLPASCPWAEDLRRRRVSPVRGRQEVMDEAGMVQNRSKL